jgi:hypothetical protein
MSRGIPHSEAVAALEALPAGETFTTTGILTATKREDGRFAIHQSGLHIGGANTAEEAARSINPQSRRRSTPEQRAKWAAEGNLGR